MPKKKKIFILDTNVILHDSTCIYNFEEHDIIIPIPVLEELDQFKKGTQIINYHAREFVRELDRLSGGGSRLFNGSMALGEGKGVLAIRLDKEMHPDLKFIFSNPERKTIGSSTSPTTSCRKAGVIRWSSSARMSTCG